MDTKSLTYFIAIAKYKNLSKAAEHLFVTQSTLSQFLIKEEQELGLQLFIRDKREMKLTYAGELYEKACKEMLDKKEKLYRELSSLQQSKTGKVRMGITFQWGARVFAKLLPEFKKKYPYNSLILTEASVRELRQQIANNSLDLACIPLPETETLNYPTIPISWEEILLAIPQETAAAEGISEANTSPNQPYPLINLERLKDYTFIIDQPGSVIHGLTEEILRFSNIVPKTFPGLSNLRANMEMVERGIGLSFTHEIDQLKSPNICYCSIAPRWYWKVVLITRRDYRLTQADQYFLNLLRNYYQEHTANRMNI